MTVNERLAAVEAELHGLSANFNEFKFNMGGVVTRMESCMEKLKDQEAQALEKLNGRVRTVEVNSSGMSFGGKLIYRILLSIVALGNVFMIIRSLLN